MHGRDAYCIQSFDLKSVVKKGCGQTAVRQTDNIKLYVEEMKGKGVGWIQLTQDRIQWWM